MSKDKGYKKTALERKQHIREVEWNARVRARDRLKFPGCIGLFPECKEYGEKDDISERPECKNCPYHKVKTGVVGE